MQKELLIYYNYGEGIGDTLISIFDILTLREYLKNNHPDISVDLIINLENRVGNSIEYMLDLKTFESYFKSVAYTKGVWIHSGKLKCKLGYFHRIFSCNNDAIENSIPGCFDILCKEEDIKFFLDLEIPFRDFILTMDSRNLPDYPVLNKKVQEDVDKFVSKNLPEEFESIFYREFKTVDYEQVNLFIEKLLPKLDKSKTYFFCTNHVEVKKIFDKLGYNLIYFRPIDKHPVGRIPNGYSPFEEDMYYALGDMILLAKSSKVHTGISRSYVSLFNFYASSIHNVPIEYIQTS